MNIRTNQKKHSEAGADTMNNVALTVGGNVEKAKKRVEITFFYLEWRPT